MTVAYVVTMHGQGDVYHTFINQEQWEAWPEGTDASTYLNSLPEEPDRTFFSLMLLIDYITKNKIEIKGSSQGCIY